MSLRRVIIMVLILILVGVAFYAAWFYDKNLRGIGPAVKPPAGDIADMLDGVQQEPTEPGDDSSSQEPVYQGTPTEMPLRLPDNFEISVVADSVAGARVLQLDANGNLWVSQPSQGSVSRVDLSTGQVSRVFQGLNNPHGLAFDPEDKFNLFIAEEDKISRVRIDSDGQLEKIIDLPGGGRHFSRTIGFGPDGKLYVSIGSSCDTCEESDSRRAAIYRLDKGGSNFELYASGLRNSVFFTWNELDGRLWATEMGRDYLGDDLPPDEINVITQGGDYGWPLCYGKNIHDTKFDSRQYVRDPCEDKQPSYIDLPAHSAPLGLDFVPKDGWPEDYAHNLIVAYHGSWNRSLPTGYKLVRLKLDESGNFLGMEDFISGWLVEGGALGRPVDVLIAPGGVMYVSDDKAGVIYKISYLKDKGEVPAGQPRARDDCVITGCSSHLCAEEETMTTCEYQEYYSCYSQAICERDSAGKCGWRLSAELLECLNNKANR